VVGRKSVGIMRPEGVQGSSLKGRTGRGPRVAFNDAGDPKRVDQIAALGPACGGAE